MAASFLRLASDRRSACSQHLVAAVVNWLLLRDLRAAAATRAGIGFFALAKCQIEWTMAGGNCLIERRPPPRSFVRLAGSNR